MEFKGPKIDPGIGKETNSRKRLGWMSLQLACSWQTSHPNLSGPTAPVVALLEAPAAGPELAASPVLRWWSD